MASSFEVEPAWLVERLRQRSESPLTFHKMVFSLTKRDETGHSFIQAKTFTVINSIPSRLSLILTTKTVPLVIAIYKPLFGAIFTCIFILQTSIFIPFLTEFWQISPLFTGPMPKMYLPSARFEETAFCWINNLCLKAEFFFHPARWRSRQVLSAFSNERNAVLTMNKT